MQSRRAPAEPVASRTLRSGLAGVCNVILLLVPVATEGAIPEGREAPRKKTALGAVAARMKAGSWAELKTHNLVPTLRARGASGAIFGYSEDGAWDPATEQFLYVGGDHGDEARFITYSAGTNTWKVMPRPEWISRGTSHGYDHNAINPAAGDFYYRPFSGKVIHSYDIKKGTWSPLPALNVPEYISCAVGVEYFPELNGLVFANLQGGSVYFFSEKSREWTTLARKLPPAGYHTFAEHNPVHKVLIFGGGGSDKKLFRLDAKGKVTQLKDAPVALGVMNTIVTVDPVGGEYLVFTRGGEFYVYDVVADRWTRRNASAVPIFKPTRVRDNKVWHVNAAPLSTYGVVMFVKYYSASTPRAWVYLYKHSAR